MKRTLAYRVPVDLVVPIEAKALVGCSHHAVTPVWAVKALGLALAFQAREVAPYLSSLNWGYCGMLPGPPSGSTP